MDDATQKLVDEARRAIENHDPAEPCPAVDVIPRLADALEAVSLANATNAREADEALASLAHVREQRDAALQTIERAQQSLLAAVDGPGMTIDAKAAIQGILDVFASAPSAQRPPVSENVRDLVDDLRESAAQSYDELSQATIDVLNRAADYISRPPVSPEALPTPEAVATDAMTGLALGAPVDPEFAHELIAAAIEADRERRLPPVSPEVREEIAAVLFDADEHHDGTEAAFQNEAHTIGGGHNRAVARAQADAILARFSFPSQPVYDEEKIARWLAERVWMPGPNIAAALVAALRGGELTREETNRG